MEYTAVVSVRGSVCLNIEAESKEEAKRIADEHVCEMDFNELEDIDWVVVNAWPDHAEKE